MTAHQLRSVNAALKHARTHSPHIRTCIGMQDARRLWTWPYVLVFFALGKIPAPVILTSPTDCKYQKPYEKCRDFQVRLLLLRLVPCHR